MNSREHLAEDLEKLLKRTKVISGVAWTVAFFVMIYGTPIVYDLATAYGIPKGVAWMLSLAADAALIVGLLATPVLAQLGIPAGWVGTLRWVSGFITLFLQTLSSWIALNMVGVAVHSAGPVLLFFVVEAASAFQRKISTAVEEKTRQLESAEQRDADRRAHLAEVEANLRASKAEITSLTSERDNALREIKRISEDDASKTDTHASEVASLHSSITDLEGKIAEQREDYEGRLRAAAKDLRQARAEASLPNIRDHQRSRTGGPTKAPSGKPGTRARFTDDEAVQRLLEAPSDPIKKLPPGDVREWSQQQIVDTLQVGWQRAPRLLEAVAEAQQKLRDGGASVGADNPDERSA